jgi:hypothetical protein
MEVVLEFWLVGILGSVGLLYLAVGFVVLFRQLRRGGLTSSALPNGPAGDRGPFLVVAALWPLYLRWSRQPHDYRQKRI